MAFHISQKITNKIDENSKISHYQDINWSFFNSLKLNIKHSLPKCCRCLCCRLQSNRDRLFKRGYKKFTNEIKITNLIKTIRILKAHIKKDYSKIQWRIFKLQKGVRQLHQLPKQDKEKENLIFKRQPFTGNISKMEFITNE